MITEDDKNGVHICLYSEGTLIATILGVRAVQSYFQHLTNISSNFLENSFYLTRAVIKKEYSGKGIFQFLMYLALREGRKQGKKVCVNLFERTSLINNLMKVEWLDLDISYSHYKLYAGKFYIEYGLSKTWNRMSSDLQKLVLDSNL